ncbi:ABC transporter permease [Actinomycetospora sp. OC33-EN08]|uniref:ABC transporter permease n=1 Tax=Actinomycetospora aurantiaca TaxID=3129233 RepID=A0ABU8MJL0_9PSEU
MTDTLRQEPSLAGHDDGAVVSPQAESGLWSDAWKQLRRRPLFIVSGIVIVVLLVMALFPSLFTGADPTFQVLDRSGEAPSAGSWFGRDLFGRDVYARAIYGAGPSLAVGLLASLGTVLVGSLAGLTMGYFRGLTDSVMSRIAEIFAGIPFVLGGIVILTSLNKPGEIVGSTRLVVQVVLTIVLLSWPLAMRIMRAAALASSQQDYVKAARALGAGPLRIMFRHMLPNCLAPVLVYGTIQLGVFIGAEATLSYLGIGLKDPVVSWGVMISEVQARIIQMPHALFFPAAFLVVTVLAFVMMGDALRDALDPRGR